MCSGLLIVGYIEKNAEKVRRSFFHGLMVTVIIACHCKGAMHYKMLVHFLITLFFHLVIQT